MSVTGDPEGEPMKVGVPVHDLYAGLHGAARMCQLADYCCVACRDLVTGFEGPRSLASLLPCGTQLRLGKANT